MAASAVSVGDRERLIDEVKRYPVLYNTTHQNHRDIDVRDRCWAEISDKLGQNCETLKREWKSLRDSFRQAVKKTNKGATTKAGIPCKKWRLQNRMSFLIPFMTVRPMIRNSVSAIKDNIKMDDTDAQSEVDVDTQEITETDTWDGGYGDHDSLDLFFASICQSTKRLPKRYQNQLKRQFLDVLLQVEAEYESEQTDDQKNSVHKDSF